MNYPKNQKVIIFSNLRLGPLHMAYELEIVEDLLTNNNEVFVVTCDNNLATCYFNPTHNLIGCAICASRSTSCYSNYPQVKKVKLKEQYDNEIIPADIPLNLKELVKINYLNYNIGRGIASSIVSLFREYDLEEIPNCKDLIIENFKMAISVIKNFEEIFNMVEPDLFILFNGRFTEMHASIQVAQKLNIPYMTFDTGLSANHYMMVENGTVVDIKPFKEGLNKLLKTIPYDTILMEGKKIIDNRLKGIQGDFSSFTTLQQKNKLPDNFDHEKINIAIFNSSEDEMKVIEDWIVDLYQNQNEAIRKIIEHYIHQTEYHFYLRIHPNLINETNSQMREIYSFNYPNLTVIPADSPVDTYHLIKATQKSITFGSTVGVEASYLEKPSIALGNSFYQGMDVVYEVNSYEQLFQLIEDKNLPPKMNNRIYEFFYALSKNGNKVVNTKFFGSKEIQFRDKKIKRFYFKTPFKLIQFLPSLGQWQKMTKLIFGKHLSFKNIFLLRSHLFDKTHQK